MGVVHRDVKPGNLLRSEAGIVKLADFGIAKAVSDESSITQVGSVLGTAAYLAPEQATGHEATPLSDIYSLGVVAYQLLAGRLPYEAQTLTELALKQQREAPPLLDHVNPDVGPELAAVIDRALALDPADRPQSAEALRAALAGEPGSEDLTRATRVIGAGAAATTVAPAAGAPGPPTTVHAAARAPVQPRRPISPARPRNQAAIAPPAPAAAAAPKRARRRRRTGRVVLTLLLLAIGTAGAVWATTTGDGVRTRKVVYENVDRTVGELQELIRQNTR
jgi:serine/threonine-protein kinase